MSFLNLIKREMALKRDETLKLASATFSVTSQNQVEAAAEISTFSSVLNLDAPKISSLDKVGTVDDIFYVSGYLSTETESKLLEYIEADESAWTDVRRRKLKCFQVCIHNLFIGLSDV